MLLTSKIVEKGVSENELLLNDLLSKKKKKAVKIVYPVCMFNAFKTVGIVLPYEN